MGVPAGLRAFTGGHLVNPGLKDLRVIRSSLEFWPVYLEHLVSVLLRPYMEEIRMTSPYPRADLAVAFLILAFLFFFFFLLLLLLLLP
jgi:hypothetical protein